MNLILLAQKFKDKKKRKGDNAHRKKGEQCAGDNAHRKKKLKGEGVVSKGVKRWKR